MSCRTAAAMAVFLTLGGGLQANPGYAQPAAGEEPMRQLLEQAQQRLREQADAIELLRREIDRQAGELETLRQKLTAPAGETAGMQAATGAATNSATHAATVVAQKPQPGETAASDPNRKPAELFFRIGNATFTPGGWVDFTGYFRSTDVGSGLGTNFASIPYNNTTQGGLQELRFTAQSSRFSMKVDETVGRIKAYGFLEADFNGYLPGNAYVNTNSNTLRMRVFYMNLSSGKWEVLGGQSWSLLTPTRKALSPFLADLFTTFHLDTNYQAGLVYARQTQFRLVYHLSPDIALGLSAENPQQFSGSAVIFPSLFSNTEADTNSSTGSGGATATPNAYPDVVAKGTFDRSVHGRYWHFGVGGLLTTIRITTPGSVTKAAAARDERTGGAVIGNLYSEIFKNFFLVGQSYWSDGGGRYIGGLGPAFVVLQNGSATAPFRAALIHSGSAIGGFEWKLRPRHTISAYYSGAYFERRYALDPALKTSGYAGYGFPGSPNSNNRSIREISFASTSTPWQSSSAGALQLITQSSYALRAPWYVAAAAPKDAHAFMEFLTLRFVIP